MKKILILLFYITIPILIFSQPKKSVLWNYQVFTSTPALKLPPSYYSGKKLVKIANEQGKEIEKKLNAALTVKKDTTELQPLIINIYNYFTIVLSAGRSHFPAPLISTRSRPIMKMAS